MILRSTAKKSKNVELNKEIKYIHKKELSNLTVNGKKVEEVSIAAMTIGTDGSLTEEGSDTTGTFTYKKQLEVGDQVAIYSGDVIPTMDMSSGDNSDVSFIEITGADGDKYTYRGSRPEDVLFMPDVLPLSMDKDQDGDPDNNSVTINVSDLTFGDDAMSRAMDLDSETTVDEAIIWHFTQVQWEKMKAELCLSMERLRVFCYQKGNT